MLRGDHLAGAIGCPVTMKDVTGAKNELVVFVKRAKRDLARQAKDQGCTVAVDVLDFFCYRGRVVEPNEFVDVVIVPNRAVRMFYKSRFPNATCVLIPHQWDSRLDRLCTHDYLRTGYIGKKFNRPEWWDGAVIEGDGFLAETAKYNLHVSVPTRLDVASVLKPATKVATAAGVMANIAVSHEPSAIELLTEEYPFYIKTKDDLERVQKSFGSKEWAFGLEIMNEVRKRTSLKAIAFLYKQLEQETAKWRSQPTPN